MGRPRTDDREKVKASILTMKLTTTERERLRALVEHRENELAGMTGQRIEVSASAFLRWLMDERARTVGLEASAIPSAPPVAKRSVDTKPPSVEQVRAEVNRLLTAKVTSGRALAESVPMDSGQLSRFRNGANISDEKATELWAACRRLVT